MFELLNYWKGWWKRTWQGCTFHSKVGPSWKQSSYDVGFEPPCSSMASRLLGGNKGILRNNKKKEPRTKNFLHSHWQILYSCQPRCCAVSSVRAKHTMLEHPGWVSIYHLQMATPSFWSLVGVNESSQRDSFMPELILKPWPQGCLPCLRGMTISYIKNYDIARTEEPGPWHISVPGAYISLPQI